MTYKESIKYFFGVINGDFYNSKADNIFELTYEEVLRLSKENNLNGEQYSYVVPFYFL